jgi:hypothetical protein
MKKIIMYMLLILSTGINAQKYVPFPTENAQWNVFYASSLYGSPMDTTLLHYSLHGDTTMNGTTYRKMCRNIGTNANPIYKSVGGLREQNKKIYYYGFGYTTYNGPIDGDSEKLLYDFNKQIGDTVWVDDRQIDKNFRRINYIISNIDSVKIGNKFRKRYTTNQLYAPEYIIEGIGNVRSGLFGVITPILTCLDCHVEWEFVCFSQNGESVYKNPVYENCGSIKKWKDSYIPFPTENAQWREVHIQQGVCDPGCMSQYKMIGDTTINSMVYHKIYLQQDTLAGTATATYAGALREQSKKIYFWSKYYNYEKRLYDFSKNVGDTLQNLPQQYLDSNPSMVCTIVKIDTTLIDGAYRKVYHLDRLYNPYVWIEGIGSTHGLLVSIYNQPTCMCILDLICFHQNNRFVYLNPSYSSCNPLIDALSTPEKNSRVHLTPNPVTDKSILKWDNSEAFATLTITNLLGKTVQTIDLRGKNEISISRDDFGKGLYIGRLVAGTGSGATVKIIVE